MIDVAVFRHGNLIRDFSLFLSHSSADLRLAASDHHEQYHVKPNYNQYQPAIPSNEAQWSRRIQYEQKPGEYQSNAQTGEDEWRKQRVSLPVRIILISRSRRLFLHKLFQRFGPGLEQVSSADATLVFLLDDCAARRTLFQL